jgi:cbb3-type cytochrome oxidase maturation protein
MRCGCSVKIDNGGKVEILYLLIPVSVVLVFFIGATFWWSLKSGQYDDLEGPAYRMLMDDDDTPRPSATPPVTEQDNQPRP